jgi:hypothetical protein
MTLTASGDEPVSEPPRTASGYPPERKEQPPAKEDQERGDSSEQPRSPIGDLRSRLAVGVLRCDESAVHREDADEGDGAEGERPPGDMGCCRCDHAKVLGKT